MKISIFRKYFNFIIIILLISLMFAQTKAFSYQKEQETLKGYKLNKGVRPLVYNTNNSMYISMVKPAPKTRFGKIYHNKIINDVALGQTGGNPSFLIYEGENYYFYHSQENNTIQVLANHSNIHINGSHIFDAIFYNEKIYLFYSSGSFFESDSIFYITYDGENWTESKILFKNIGHSYSIYTKKYNGILYMFYSSNEFTGNATSVYYTYSEDGEDWKPPKSISSGDDHQHVKNVFVYNGSLYCIWSSYRDYHVEVREYNGEYWSDAHIIKTTFGNKKVYTTQIYSELFNNKLYIIYHHTSEKKRGKVSIGFLENLTINPVIIRLHPTIYSSPSTVVHNDSLWIFYDDGEYIRYITYDGENFDYAEVIEQDDQLIQTEALARYWWLIALAGIVAVILTAYFYSRRKGEHDDVAEDLEKDNHL